MAKAEKLRADAPASAHMREFRRIRQLSQTAAGKLIGVTQPTWSDIENEVKEPRLKNMFLITDVVAPVTGLRLEAWRRREWKRN